MPAHERQESDLTGALDRDGKLALVPGTGACHPARDDLALLRHRTEESLLVLVVDYVDLVLTESAELAVSLVPSHSCLRNPVVESVECYLSLTMNMVLRMFSLRRKAATSRSIDSGVPLKVRNA